MALSVDQIFAKFLHKAFPVMDSKQDHQRIHGMQTLLYGNTSILTTMLGGGNHSNIRLVG